MNVKAIAFLSLLAVSTLGAPAFSQTQEIDVSKIPKMKIEDWRSPSSCSPPWSTPALAYALRTAPLEVATIRAEFADSRTATFVHSTSRPALRRQRLTVHR